jgi:hypothetical protein
MNTRRILVGVLLILGLLLAPSLGLSATQGAAPLQEEGPLGVDQVSATPLGAGFTYQGLLKQDGNPITGLCDLQFGLYDGATLGSQVGITQTQTIDVADGLFTAQLDFGGEVFNGDARWLAVAVRCPAGSGSYTSLGRQALTAVPYALYAKKVGYKGVIVVAQSGGDFASIQAALDSITDNSADNRYLVWVAPGTYTETVTMKEHVDIEGAGELLTMISYAGSAVSSTGTVVGANDAELRFLTVQNTGGNTHATAIYNSSASPRLTHVTASAAGGTWSYGVQNRASSAPTMTHVTISAAGGTTNYGVYNFNSAPTMTDVSASASGGTNNYGILSYSSAPTMMRVIASASGGTNHYGVYNASCSPTMARVTASASGGTSSYGVYNDSSSPAMTDVTASATGGSDSNHGVHNTDDSSPTMTRVTCSASGGDANHGVHNDSSSLTILDSTITAGVVGEIGYGIYNVAASGTYIVEVSNCQITSSSYTIWNDNGDNNYTLRVGASLLDGGTVTGAGTAVCAGVFNENFIFCNPTGRRDGRL